MAWVEINEMEMKIQQEIDSQRLILEKTTRHKQTMKNRT
jgi:hypothetical protein